MFEEFQSALRVPCPCRHPTCTVDIMNHNTFLTVLSILSSCTHSLTTQLLFLCLFLYLCFSQPNQFRQMAAPTLEPGSVRGFYLLKEVFLCHCHQVLANGGICWISLNNSAKTLAKTCSICKVT